MTPELEALGRRAVACAVWKWMPGMQFRQSVNGATCRVERAYSGSVYTCDGYRVRGYAPSRRKGWLPDLSDPATLGCLLALVREAHRDPWLFAAPESGAGEGPPYWRVSTAGADHTGDTEAEAIVAALEAAP